MKVQLEGLTVGGCMVPKVSNEKYGPRFGCLGDLFGGINIFYPVFFVGGFPFDILAKNLWNCSMYTF